MGLLIVLKIGESFVAVPEPHILLTLVTFDAALLESRSV